MEYNWSRTPACGSIFHVVFFFLLHQDFQLSQQTGPQGDRIIKGGGKQVDCMDTIIHIFLLRFSYRPWRMNCMETSCFGGWGPVTIYNYLGESSVVLGCRYMNKTRWPKDTLCGSLQLRRPVSGSPIFSKARHLCTHNIWYNYVRISAGWKRTMHNCAQLKRN